MSIREFLILLVMCLIWGVHFIVVKLAVAEISPITYAAIRMSVVAACMAYFLRWRKRQMLPVFIAGVCLGALNYALLFTGTSYATASAAAVAVELTTPFATILSVFILGEKVGIPRITGICCAMGGVALIAFNADTVAGAPNVKLGVGLIAIAAMCEAIGAISVKRATGFKPFELLAWFSLIGTVILWPLSFVLEPAGISQAIEADMWLVVGAVLYSAILASIVAHSAYYWLLQRLPVSVVAPSVMLTTIFGVISGVIFLKDPINSKFIIGVIMTLLGVGIILYRNPKRTTPSIDITSS